MAFTTLSSGVVSFLVLFASCSSLAATPLYGVGVFTESSGDLRSQGITLGLRTDDTSPYYVDVILSYQRLQLRDTPAEYRRDAFSPFFVAGRVGLSGTVSPYVQVGVDVAHAVKSMFEQYGDSCCNINAQLGVSFSPLSPVTLDFYGTWYSVKYQTGRLVDRYENDRWQSREEYDRFSPLGVGMRLSVAF